MQLNAEQSVRPVLSWLKQRVSVRDTQIESWRGGVHLPDQKHLSNRRHIRHAPLPRMLCVPLGWNGREAQPVVVPGQRVLKGQAIASGVGTAVWVHAPTSGIVKRIMPVPVAPGTQMPTCIVIESDGEDEWGMLEPLAREETSIDTLSAFLMQKGLVGLGGAGFPTGLKLKGGDRTIDTLVVNGAECEPFITCDDRLMRERALSVLQGVQVLANTLQVDRVRIGIEDNKPTAIRRMQEACAQIHSNIEVVEIPTRYPAGSLRHLVKALTGRTIPEGALPAAIGVTALNVATAFAVGQAVLEGRPLISRIVTVTGLCERPGNFEVPIGMGVRQLIGLALPQPDARGVHVGGPMMGESLAHRMSVVAKTTSCLIVGARSLLPPRPEPTPCIRCSRCADACPVGLQPMELFRASSNDNRPLLATLKINSCIECGACSYVCPSNIPLRDTFRQQKRAQAKR
ncbi:electron transport complex subunit RsxC [Parachitinimonas caeni]|uniref:Ion-translocating oxidoreductase complex subunit C n=1 Tax=Parachitinimonas caeni TaxID=3031301 RepID=A0ABT7DRZ7_9NEIS|nr:electron transport complex subunit RsxC [Parachitinimonas caeni]MDK2122559.1 electron transport complex subunit RsxC [Parachitinimonas caeni]